MSKIDFYLEQNSLPAVDTVACGISSAISSSSNSLTKEKRWDSNLLVGVFLFGSSDFKTGTGSWWSHGSIFILKILMSFGLNTL